jgi:subtilisin
VHVKNTYVLLVALLAGCGSYPDGGGDGSTTSSLEGSTADVIVVLRDGQAPRGESARSFATQVAASHGLQEHVAYGHVFAGFAATVPAARLRNLLDDPRVAYVNTDAPVQAIGKPGGGGGGPGPGQVVPWGITAIGADMNAHEGAGIHVYVIDTGIDGDHPDLKAHMGNGTGIVACRGRGCGSTWDDDNGHGTHVAGTIGAIDNATGVVGVAAQTTLHAVKVLDRTGSGSWAGVIAGIDWVAKETAARGKPSVANMSLGGGGAKVGTCSNAGFVGNDAMHQAICAARNAGVVFAVAAGNEGASATTSVPAAYDDTVITVSAVSALEDWPWWSNYGDLAGAWLPTASAPVSLAAPGVSVLSLAPGGGTATMSGTSMATPHVTGAAALWLGSNPGNADGTAFENTRAGLVAAASSTAAWVNTSGNPHAEGFLNASDL